MTGKRTHKRPETEERRNVLRGLATGLAGAVAVPSVGVATELEPKPRQSAPSVPPITPGLLDEAELETLESLAELLVPGSVAAGVPGLLNRVAFVETQASQRELVDALRAFEGEARLRHRRRWTELDDAARRGILERASAAASESEATLHEHFVKLRDRVAAAYFATAAGMEELGWTRRSTWSELPGCDHPGDDHR